jgi:hypothetical protein
LAAQRYCRAATAVSPLSVQADARAMAADEIVIPTIDSRANCYSPPMHSGKVLE